MTSYAFSLIAGLGNPGTKYQNTRHNVGFMAVKYIASKNSTSFSTNKKILGELADIKSNTLRQRLLMPKTYMNESGRSIKATMSWFDIPLDKLLVIVDDMDLPLGTLRFRTKGGSGGHKGLKSIIDTLATQSFSRLKIGIGAPSQISNERKAKTISHVLGDFNNKESEILEKTFIDISKGLDLLKDEGLAKGTTFINSLKI